MTREIPLTLGQVALVDDEDYDALVAQGKWRAMKRKSGCPYYAMNHVPKSEGGYFSQCMHRFIMATPKDLETDHINGDGLDNRRANLRNATHTQNGANRHKRSTGTSSQYKGVSYRPARWEANINWQREHRYLGSFASEEEAARAYDEAAREVHGEFACLNFPEDSESNAAVERAPVRFPSEVR